MTKYLLFFFFVLPIKSFSLSEKEQVLIKKENTNPLQNSSVFLTRQDPLEWGRKKGLSSNSLRAEFRFSLKRNLEISRFTDILERRAENSLLSLSNLHYDLQFDIYYSLRNILQSSTIFLENTEVFLKQGLSSPFQSKSVKNFSDYMHYALKDFIVGFTTPVYTSDTFLSDFDLSVVLLPLSRYSRQATLHTTWEGKISFKRKLKQKSTWILALLSSHQMSYSYYKKDLAKNDTYNTPWDTTNTLNLIYNQIYNSLLPLSTKTYISHYFGINKNATHHHDLTVGGVFSWKITSPFYIQFKLYWKDRILTYNPRDAKVGGNKKHIRVTADNLFFILGGIYYF